MSKLRITVIILIIILLGAMALLVGAYQTRETSIGRDAVRSWRYDEHDKSTWWYEGHTLNSTEDFSTE